jgi:DNA-binding response OmpR family regulator
MRNTRKILIVDDDPELRDALTDQLSLHEEFEAAAAENGTKGVQVAKEGQVDVVIMDVGLPDIDGYAGEQTASRERLLQEVWSYNSGVTTRTLETHIYRLRQKIEKDATAPAILVTAAGGYKLVL